MLLTAPLCVSALALAQEATVDEIVTMARDYLGGDEKLASIQTITYRGEFENTTNLNTGEINIFLEKPLRQRMEVIDGEFSEITAIDDYDGWKQRKNRGNAADWAFVVLPVGELKRMRANTWENLNFFRGIEKLRGEVIHKGKTRKDGRDAYLLLFRYDDEVFYERYFDVATGELIATVNDQGIEIREMGEMRINGIRFPEKVVTLYEGEVINTVTFTEILINENLSDSLFEMPVLGVAR